jgi:DNA-binding FadR family transcriptional regulator
VLRSGYLGQEKAISDHRKIVAAIRSGDPNAAERRMREHLEWVMTITPEEQRRALEARRTSPAA